MRTMKTKDGSSRKSGKSKTNAGAAGSVALGDVIYVRLRSGSWWPAQVVDENRVSESQKPTKRSKSLALVRLYGSYVYMYVDPVKSRSEFEVILKRNNGSLAKILQESLEQDLPSAKASRSKGSASKSEGTSSKSSTSKRKSNEQDEEQDKLKGKKQTESSTSKRKSNEQDEEQDKLKGKKQTEMPNVDDLGSPNPERSSRRVRVMENLGLIAPAGSPFQRNTQDYDRNS